MTYKDSLDLLESKIKIQAYNRKLTVHKLTDGEKMQFMSQVQQWLGDTFSLYEKSAVIDLVEGQTTYTGTSNIPADLLRILTAETNKDGDNKVDITSKEEINNTAKLSGLPTKLTIYNTNSGRTIEINSTPTYD